MSIESNFTGRKEIAIGRVTLFTDYEHYPDEMKRAIVYHFEENVFDADGKLMSSSFNGQVVSRTFGAIKDQVFAVPMPDGSTFKATGLQAASLIKFVGYTLKAEDDAKAAQDAAQAQQAADAATAEQQRLADTAAEADRQTKASIDQAKKAQADYDKKAAVHDKKKKI